MKHNHYFKPVKGLTHIDVYRVLSLFEVTDPCLQHAVKKLLVAGGRGSKGMGKDIQEAMDSLQRWQDMQVENGELDFNARTIGESEPALEKLFQIELLQWPKVVEWGFRNGYNDMTQKNYVLLLADAFRKRNVKLGELNVELPACNLEAWKEFCVLAGGSYPGDTRLRAGLQQVTQWYGGH